MRLNKRVAAFVLGVMTAGPVVAQDFQFKVPTTKAELEAVVAAGVRSIKGLVGVYMKHVESGEAVGLNENTRFQLASVFKIPVLVTLHEQISLGRVSLDDRINFLEKMKTYGSGLMASMKPGLNISVQDLQLLMMARSDNTATDILFDLVTPGAIADAMKDLGLRNTTIDYNTRQLILDFVGLDPAKSPTIAELGRVPESVWSDPATKARQTAFEASTHNTSTPCEIALLLEKCVKGEVFDRATSDRILETMKSHTGAEVILRYLPESTEIARKGGSLSKGEDDVVLLDSAVIWLPANAGHLIICIWGNRLEETHYVLKHKMGLMARAAYDYFLARNSKSSK